MRLLGISGSLRGASLNTALVRAAAEAFAPDSFTLADLNLPLYDGDVEARGMPEAVLALNAAIRDADAIVIATPEYNAGLSGVLKNALDWSSRVRPMPLTGKPVAILSAAAGKAGGQRAQMTLRHCLLAFDTRLIQAPQVFVHASAFSNGALSDELALRQVALLAAALRDLVRGSQN